MNRVFLIFCAVAWCAAIVTGCEEPQPHAPGETSARQDQGAPPFDPDVPVFLPVEGVGNVMLYLNPDDQVITPMMLKTHAWEKTETAWFVTGLRRGDVVADVGANIGYYTVLAAMRVGPQGKVHAFEPDPVAFELLKKNVELNRLHNVVLEQKAVSNAPGSIRLFLSEENKGDHRIYQPEGEARPSVEVEAVALDDYFAGQPAPDFIKVDTQGAELVIYQGMAKTLERAESVVVAIEYSPIHLAGFGATGPQLLDEIERTGFAMYDLGGVGVELEPLVPTDRASLLKRFSPERWHFTNLYLVKGRPDLIEQIEAQLPGR